MGMYWTGTGFEERLAPPMPPGLAASEPQSAAIKDAPESGNAENRKNNDSGPVRFDPIQGVWTRAEIDAALSPESIVQPAAIAVVSPQLKPTPDTGSFFKWTSWFRTESEKGETLVAPLPADAPEANLPAAPCEDASGAHASIAAQYVAAAEAEMPGREIAVADEIAAPPAPSFSAGQDAAASETRVAAGDETTSPEEPALPQTQDLAASDTQSTADEKNFVPEPSLGPGENRGGTMWQTANNEREAAANAPRSAGEAPRAAHGGNPSRWFVLNGMLGGAPAAETVEPAGSAPVLEVFSLAGGVGKTSLVATLGRALSARGERVLLVEATPLASMQYYFGAYDSRPGALRTFRPPVSSSDAPIRLVTVDTDAPAPAAQGSLAGDIQRWAQGASRTIVDVATGSSDTVRSLAKMSPVILVPLVPDINSVVTAHAIDSFFQRQSGAPGGQSSVFYVLNQFDSSLPLHLDVRNVLRERLGERLLPFALERTPAVSEALAEGMTVMDYAPESQIAADFALLAIWLEDVLAPAKSSASGRWSER